MNCKQFQSQLERAIDKRSDLSTDRASFASHADSCESCGTAWQDFLLLESALASWSEPVEVDLVDRVIAAARPSGSQSQTVPTRSVSEATAQTESSSAPVSHRRVWTMVASVAVVLLGVAIAFRRGPDQTASTDSDPPPPPPPETPFELNEDDQYAGVDELLASTRSAWQGITSKAVNQASGLRVFVPDLKSDLGLRSSPEPEEPAPEEDPEERSIVPGGIDRAFDFLLEVSPDVTTT